MPPKGDDGTWMPDDQGSDATWSPEGPAPEAPGPPIASSTRFRLGAEVARGGLGRIVEGWDEQLEREVAIKLLLRPSPHAEARFDREMLLTARLQHPNIVPVFDGGRLNDLPYLAMRRVHGRSLAEALDACSDLDARMRLLPHVIDVANAIAYAHDQRVVHRDLKPDNVLVGGFGETVVIDWGLAKDLDVDITEEVAPPAVSLTPSPQATPLASGRRSTSRSLTRMGSVMGTPRYMPPEQAAGASVDARCDVYALGAILYEVLAGQGPYEGEDDILEAVRSRPPEPVERWAPEAPKDLTAVVHRAMAREPSERYADAASFAADLQRFLEGRFVSAYDYSPVERVVRLVRSHPLATVLLAVLVLGTGVSFLLLDGARGQAEANEAAARRLEVAAVDREDQIRLDQARTLTERDPAQAIQLLAGLSERTPFDGKVRSIFSAAMASRPAQQWSTLAQLNRPYALVGDELLVIQEDGVLVHRASDGVDRWILEGLDTHLFQLDRCALLLTETELFRYGSGKLENLGSLPTTLTNAAPNRPGVGLQRDGRLELLQCDGPTRDLGPAKRGWLDIEGEDVAVAGGHELHWLERGVWRTSSSCDSSRWGVLLSKGRVFSVGDAASLCIWDADRAEASSRPVADIPWLEHIVEDGRGDLYVAGGRHVLRLDREGNELGRWEQSAPVFALAAADQGVWIGTSTTLARWDGEVAWSTPVALGVRSVHAMDGDRVLAAVGSQVRQLDLAPSHVEVAAADDQGFVMTDMLDELPLDMFRGRGTPPIMISWCAEQLFVLRRRQLTHRGRVVASDVEQARCLHGEPALLVSRPGQLERLPVTPNGLAAADWVHDWPDAETTTSLKSVTPNAVVSVGNGLHRFEDGELREISDAGPFSVTDPGQGDTFVATNHEGILRLGQGAPSRQLARVPGSLTGQSSSPEAIALGMKSGAVLYLPDEGSPHVLERHGRWVSILQFDDTGRWLATGGWDNRVVLWDLSTDPPEGRLLGEHGDGVDLIRFFEGGLLSIAHNGEVMWWPDPWPTDHGELRDLVLEANQALIDGRPLPLPPPAPPPPIVWHDLDL